MEQEIRKLNARISELESKSLTSNQDETPRSVITQSVDSLCSSEIDFEQLVGEVWRSRFVILLFTLIISIFSIFYSLSLPNIYKAEEYLSPTDSQSSAMSGLASQYAGLASFTGINLGAGTGNSDVSQSIILIKSWHFISEFINKHKLAPLVIGVKGWDEGSNTLIYNHDIYDPTTNSWKEGVAPSSYEIYEIFRSFLTVEYDSAAGIVIIAIEYYSPKIAVDWINLLINDVNQYYQQQDVKEAKTNIALLTEKASKSDLSFMDEVFYNLIEQQTKTLMLAQGSEQYLLKTVVPAMSPEKKSKPNRSLFVILATFVGCVFSMLLVLVRFSLRFHKRS